MIDESARYSILLEYYGGLLTKRQRSCAELYHDENLSLAEIAEEFGISRQAVHDSLKTAQSQLNSFEEKLHLGRRLLEREELIENIDKRIGKILEKRKNDPELAEELQTIKDIIDSLGEKE